MKATGFAHELKRRQKASLWSTLICVGLILILGGGVRVAVGIMFLGVAFSWTLGSNSRLVHWFFVVFGVLLLAVPAADWHSLPQRRAERIELDKSIIESNRKSFETFSDMAKSDEKSGWAEEERKDLHEMANSANDVMKAQLQLAKDEAETKLFGPVIRETWEYITGGLLLLCSGLGLIVGVKPATEGALK